jgi:RES domain-containing protein
VTPPVSEVRWTGARRIIRSLFPPIDLFEDIADPADWPLLVAAEQKTNPRLVEAIGTLDLVPPGRRVGGPGASYLMGPFTHASPDRPSRFADGGHGALYVARGFETALHETMHHHAAFMRSTKEAPGWTSAFREIVLDVSGALHDLRSGGTSWREWLAPDSHAAARAAGRALREAGAEGIVYPSVRDAGGECAALFYPDLASGAHQGRHLDYYWNGERVQYVRELSIDGTSRRIWQVEP